MNFRIGGRLLGACAASCMSMGAFAMEADVKIGGAFAYSLSEFSSDATGDDFDAENNGSYVGLKAAIEQSGIRAFLVYERGFDRYNPGSANTESQDYVREFFGGIEGPYGRLTGGRQSSFYKEAGRQIDPFYDTSAAGFNGQFANEGASFGLSNLTNGFTSNTVAYESPSVADGLRIRGAVFASDNGEPDDEEDFGFGAVYASETYRVIGGVEYIDSAGPVVTGFPAPGGSAYRVYAGFKPVEALSLGASYESVDVDQTADARRYIFVSASYKVIPRLKLAVAYGNAEKTPFDGDGITVGAFYEVIPRLTAYVAARSVSLDSGDDTSTIAAGASFDFDLDLN